MATRLLLLSTLLLSSTVGRAASMEPRADADLCTAAHFRGALSRDVLYFMASNLTTSTSDDVSNLEKIYAIPLNESFSTSGLLPSSSYQSYAAPGVPYKQGVFWIGADEQLIYAMGGNWDATPANNVLSRFNTSSKSWDNVSVSGGDFNYQSRTGSLVASTVETSEGLGFLSGGYGSGPTTLTGMVRMNMSDPENLSWKNLTDNPPLTLEGNMEFVRYGEQGVLIAIGGFNFDYYDPDLVGWGWDARNMSQIGVYDIASDTWYNVTASGDIPSWRSAACTAVSAAPDDSSFQIMFYGGKNLFEKNLCYEDMYVLTLPSFQWINVTGSNNNSELDLNQGQGVGRAYSYCTAWKEREMVVLGGQINLGNESVNLGTCNSSYSTMRVLDLSTFEWKGQHDPDPGNYTVPDVVVRRIGGSSTGGATSAAPSGGFEEGSLNQIFATTVPIFIPESASSEGSGNSSATSATPGRHHTSDTAAIAGGTVGGVVGLGIIISILVFCLRYRRRTRHLDAKQNQSSSWASTQAELPEETKLEQYNELGSESAYHELDPNATKRDTENEPVELPS